MYYWLFPEKDSTIYESSIHQNTGRDQILELEKQLVHSQGDVPWNSRILIKFDLDNFSQSLVSGYLSGSDMKYYLNLYTCEAYEIPVSYTVEVFPISQSWEMGVGKRGDNPIQKTGVSWELRDGVTVSGITGSAWVTSGSDYLSGSNYTQYYASQSFDYQTTDLHVDVTNIVEAWLSGSITNHGFLIRRTIPDEKSILNQGTLQFFSKETHTIYRPRLEVVWKDFSYSPYVTTSVSYSYTAVTSSDSIIVSPIISYTTNSFYSGSSVFSTSSYFTKSGDDSTWYSESYYFLTASVWSYTSSIGLYHSSSFVTSSTYYEYVYTSGSNTHISRSLKSTSSTISDFYTASLGSEFLASTDANVSYSIATPGMTSSIVWTYYDDGYYYSESFTAVTASYTYTSSSIDSYSTSSSSTTTYLMSSPGNDDFTIYLDDLKDEYRQNARVKFRLKARDRYPRKTYVTRSWSYTIDSYFLPSHSYYSVRDAWDEYQWVPFSDYSQLSVDSTGSYFNLDLNGLEPERLYRLIFQTIQNSGSSSQTERIFDNNYTFRIIR